MGRGAGFGGGFGAVRGAVGRWYASEQAGAATVRPATRLLAQRPFCLRFRTAWLASAIAQGLLATALHAQPADRPSAAELAAYTASAFPQWVALASARTVSPATPAPGDLAYSWQAPDGRAIRAVVKVPHPAAGAPDITLPPVAQDADARPVFEKALAEVRARGAGRLKIPLGTYVFRSIGGTGSAHLTLSGLADVTIDGGGSTFIFTQNATGIFVRASQRVRLVDCTIAYGLRMVSLGTIRDRSGEKIVAVDPGDQVGPDDQVYYLLEFDRATQQWVPGGRRVILPPGSASPAVFDGDHAYRSRAFASLPEGMSFTLFHQFYGGNAIRIGDSPAADEAEDIVIDHVHIASGPGMGIFAYGMKRGLAIINSQIAPRPDSRPWISTEYDAIHVLELGGDLVISNNTISGQGDDAINLNSPVAMISKAGQDPRDLVMAPYSRFMTAGDVLGFFGRAGQFAGTAAVTATRPLGGLNYEIGMGSPGDRFDKRDLVRDVTRIDSRFVIAGNRISRCHCHGILVQIPNGLVENNTMSGTLSGIRLLANTGFFKEGAGAINVVVRNNVVTDTIGDKALGNISAAIMAYAPIGNGELSPYPVNSNLAITSNTVSAAADACVTISSSQHVTVADNRCNSVNLSGQPLPSIIVVRAGDVVLRDNVRTGVSSGGMSIDPETAARVTRQERY
jgi:hypothetical protein